MQASVTGCEGASREIPSQLINNYRNKPRNTFIHSHIKYVIMTLVKRSRKITISQIKCPRYKTYYRRLSRQIQLKVQTEPKFTTSQIIGIPISKIR